MYILKLLLCSKFPFLNYGLAEAKKDICFYKGVLKIANDHQEDDKNKFFSNAEFPKGNIIQFRFRSWPVFFLSSFSFSYAFKQLGED